MRPTFLLVPAFAIGAAACGSDPTSVTVHLDASSASTGTAEVLVHHPAGDSVSRTPLVAGDNDVPVDDGETVTVALGDGTSHDLQSAFGVHRGDVIYAQARPAWPDGYHHVQIQVPTVANADTWMIEHPDGGSDGQGAGLMTYVLPGRTTLPLLLTAVAADQSTLAMFGDAAAPISGDAIDLSTHAPLGLATTQVTVSGAAAGASIDLGSTVWFGDDGVGVPVFPAAGAIVSPTGIGDIHSLSVFASSSSSGIGVITSSATPYGDHVDLDVGTLTVPDLTAPTFDGSSISWGTTGGSDFDGYSGGIEYADGSSWTVFAPATATVIDLPQLPADLVPTTAAQSGNLVAFGYDDLDYDGYLAGPVAPSDGSRWELRGVDLTVAGSTAASFAGARSLDDAMRAVVTRRRR